MKKKNGNKERKKERKKNPQTFNKNNTQINPIQLFVIQCLQHTINFAQCLQTDVKKRHERG